MVSSAKFSVVNDRVSIEILNHKIFVEGDVYRQKTEPIRNGIGLSKSEFRQWVADFAKFNNWVKKMLNNDFLKNGLPMPYTSNELLTNLEFQERQMHVMIEVGDHLDQYIEDVFWDDTAIEERDDGYEVEQ